MAATERPRELNMQMLEALVGVLPEPFLPSLDLVAAPYPLLRGQCLKADGGLDLGVIRPGATARTAVRILNAGAGRLTIASIVHDADRGWLGARLGDGAGDSLPHSLDTDESADIGINVDARGLAPGKHLGSIGIGFGNADVSPITVPISVEVPAGLPILEVRDGDGNEIGDAVIIADEIVQTHRFVYYPQEKSEKPKKGRKSRKGGKAQHPNTVYLAGDFTGWESGKIRMTRQLEEEEPEQERPGWIKGGRISFVADVPLASGTHQYKFIVDGSWENDPNNPATESESGNANSVLAINSWRSLELANCGKGLLRYHVMTRCPWLAVAPIAPAGSAISDGLGGVVRDGSKRAVGELREGEKTLVGLRVKAEMLNRGWNSGTIGIITNSAVTAQRKLKIEARVQAVRHDALIEVPAGELDFGDVRRGGEAIRRILVTNQGGVPVEGEVLVEIPSRRKGAAATAAGKRTFNLPADDDGPVAVGVAVTLHAGDPLGRIAGMATLKVKHPSECLIRSADGGLLPGKAVIPFKAGIYDYVLEPAKLDFGEVGVGAEKEMCIKLARSDKNPVALSRVTVGDSLISHLRVARINGDRAIVSFAGGRRVLDDEVEGELILADGNNHDAVCAVAVRARLRSRELRVTHCGADRIVHGSQGKIRMRAANVGGGMLTIKEVRSLKPWLRLEDMSLPVALSENAFWNFSAVIDTTGMDCARRDDVFQGAFEIRSNDPTNPVHRVSFSVPVQEGARLEVSPQTLDMGTVRAGTRKSASLRLSNPGSTPVTVRKIATLQSDWMDLSKLRMPVTIGPGEGLSLLVTADPRAARIAERRTLNGEVLVWTKGSPEPECRAGVDCAAMPRRIGKMQLFLYLLLCGFAACIIVLCQLC